MCELPCRTLAEIAAATSVHVVAVIEPIIQHADWFFPGGTHGSRLTDCYVAVVYHIFYKEENMSMIMYSVSLFHTSLQISFMCIYILIW